jgi:hypothetical protein
VDWGCGAIGDMGAHLIDHPFWALDLGYPTSVETVSTPFNKATYPGATTTYYQFPARGDKPAVKLTWYDGALFPPRPEELGETRLNPTGGVLYYGSKGKLMHDTYGFNPKLLPQSLAESAPTPPQKLPRIKTSHEMNWVEAAKNTTEASCPFSYAAQLTEVMLLGVVLLRAGTKIHSDAANMRVTNNAAANDFLKREYRQGWTLTYPAHGRGTPVPCGRAPDLCRTDAPGPDRHSGGSAGSVTTRTGGWPESRLISGSDTL